MTLARQRLLVFVFPVLLALPFLNRAFFVDDHYFVEIAAWLAENPARPYDFRTDDAGLDNPGWEPDGMVRMVNPLFHHYYLAALYKLGDGEVWFLRLGAVLLVSAGAICLFELARRWTLHPLLSTFLVLSTPTMWLTSHSLLIDSTLGALFVSALYFFIRAGERDSLGAMVASGLLAGLASITKYPAVLFFPVSAVWWWMYRKKHRRFWLPVAGWTLALGIFAAYGWYTFQLYGDVHILAASKRMVRVFGWPKLMVLGVFLSGVTLVPLVSWRFLDRNRVLFLVACAVATVLGLASRVGGFAVHQAAMIAGFFTTTAAFFWTAARRARSFIYPRDHFLLVWAVGFVAMMVVVMDWVAGRYFVIVAPAVVFISIRLVEIARPETAASWLRRLLLGTLAFGGALAYADYRQAEPARALPRLLSDAGISGGSGRYFMGDAFTMSYLGDHGWTPYFPGTALQSGDLVVSKRVTMPPIYPWRREIGVRPIAEFTFPSRFPLKVMDYRGAAGFYASVWGALPFTFSTGPWERFIVYRVESRKGVE